MFVSLREYLIRESAAAYCWQICAVPSVEALSLMTIRSEEKSEQAVSPVTALSTAPSYIRAVLR